MKARIVYLYPSTFYQPAKKEGQAPFFSSGGRDPIPNLWV